MFLLLDIAGRFADDVIGDLVWLKSKTAKYNELGNPLDGHGVARRWLQIALDHPQAWKDVLKEVRDDEILRIRLAPPEEGPGDDLERDKFACYRCGEGFKTWKALRTHSMTVHGVYGEHAKAVHGTVCRACLVQHHTFERAVHHMRRSRCYERILTNVGPASAATTRALKHADRALRKAIARGIQRPAEARAPAIRVSGPLPLWADH